MCIRDSRVGVDLVDKMGLSIAAGRLDGGLARGNPDDRMPHLAILGGVRLAICDAICEPMGPAAVGLVPRPFVCTPNLRFELGSLIKKRRKKMSKHKYRKRQKANRHKKKA